MIVRSDLPSVWEQVDEICEQMHRAWESDAPRRVEEWLPKYPEVASEPEAVFDLIYTEYLLEEPQQGQAALEDLYRRFPEFADRLQRQILVHEALQKTVDHHDDPTHAGGAAPTPITPGSTIGKFRIEEELGRGGMGIVYRAHDTQLQRDVALKVLKSGELADEFEVRRFENEMAAAASLDHPHIVPVLEVGRHADRPYFVMKLIRGGSLAGRLREFTGQPRRCAEILLPIARAVQHMHLQGILHRDLKPSNILIDRTGQPQVTDFGLARAARGTSQLTASGDVLGTLPYLAPELIEQSSQASSVLSDVYGLGALLYTLLVGRWPHEAHTPAEIIRRITSESVPPPRRIEASVPHDLQTICLKALERRPADRYQSAGDVADELQQYLEGRPIEARPAGWLEASWKWVRRKPWSAALAGLLAVLTIALLSVSTLSTLRIRGLNSSLEDQLDSAREAQAEARQAQTEAERSQAEAESQAWTNRNLVYAADMRLALVAYHNGDSQQAIEILNRHLPNGADAEDLRGFEWHLLRNLTDRPFAPLGETGKAGYFITFSTDGRSVAAGGQSGRITIYDVAPQTRQLEIDSQQGEVNGLAYSPDGAILASAGDDGTARLWDVATGAQLTSIQAHDDEAFQVAFAANGQQLITCGKDPVIRMWDITTGAAAGTFVGHTDDVEAIAVSPDGRLLVSASRDATARLWRVAEAGESAIAEWGFEATASSVAFSADGGLLAAGDIYGEMIVARIEDVDSGPSAPIQIQNVSPVQSLAFVSQEDSLVVGDRAGVLTVYAIPADLAAVESIAPTLSWQGHHDRVYGVAADSDNGFLASISRDGTARLWQGTGDEHCIQRTELRDLGFRVAILSNTESAVTVSMDWQVECWDLASGRKLSSRLAAGSDWRELAALGHNQFVLAGPDGILLWDMSQRASIATRPLPEGYEDSAVMYASPSADRIAICAARQDVPACVLNGLTLETLAEIPTDYATCLAWHPSDQFLAVPSHNQVQLWNTREQRFTATLPSHKGNVCSLSFSADGRLLAIARDDRSIDIWNLEENRYELTDQIDGARADLLTFTPDGRTLLASFSLGREITAWHVPTGRPLGVLHRTAGVIRHMRMTPDGRSLVVLADKEMLVLRTK